jgi:hypothetical protein
MTLSESYDEESAELPRGRPHGYLMNDGRLIPSTEGFTRKEVLDQIMMRQDLLSGQQVRRFDIGFVADGNASSSLPAWRNRILSEYFSIVSAFNFCSWMGLFFFLVHSSSHAPSVDGEPRPWTASPSRLCLRHLGSRDIELLLSK